MADREPERSNTVTVSVELVGDYEDILPKLRDPETEPGILHPVGADLSRILDTVERLDGGTRSAIVANLPEGMEHDYEAETVVDALQVLSCYDLVTLDGNTWKSSSGSDD